MPEKEDDDMSDLNGNTQQQQLPPPGVLVQPVPFLPIVGVVEPTPGTKVVSLRIETQTGMFCIVIDPKDAKDIGKQLMACSRSALLGLDLPPGVVLNEEPEEEK